MGRSRDGSKTHRVLLRRSARRNVLERDILNPAATTTSILRYQRYHAFTNDQRPAVVDILLHARPEGPDRRRRLAQLPHLPAQCCRQHPKDVRPCSTVR